MRPYGLDSNITKLLAMQHVNQAICILLLCQLYFVILFSIKNITIIVIIIIIIIIEYII